MSKRCLDIHDIYRIQRFLQRHTTKAYEKQISLATKFHLCCMYLSLYDLVQQFTDTGQLSQYAIGCMVSDIHVQPTKHTYIVAVSQPAYSQLLSIYLGRFFWCVQATGIYCKWAGPFSSFQGHLLLLDLMLRLFLLWICPYWKLPYQHLTLFGLPIQSSHTVPLQVWDRQRILSPGWHRSELSSYGSYHVAKGLNFSQTYTHMHIYTNLQCIKCE